jgi:MoaA/NifB/PqqE/SkfB family radical SAM enzyme
MLQADMDMKLYMKLIGEWREHGLKYIHFTGGEATIHPELPDYVKIASDNAILSAITTNGVAEPGLYERLIENGLYEIRISIDTFDEEKYDEIVGVKHAFGRLIRNIKDI